MSNILNHNRNIFDFKLDLSNYWDFHICLDQYGVNGNANLNNSKCEVVNIDFNNPDCVWFDTIYSDFKNTWGDAINNGITLCHAHHPRVRAEEKRLISKFQKLVSVSK